MARQQKKPKAGSQTSKKRRKVGSGGGGGSSGSKGLMTGMRGAFKSAAGAGKGGKREPGKLSKAIDIALWIAVAIAIGYFIVNAQCTQ